jgi:S1-C subfamily serine protease
MRRIVVVGLAVVLLVAVAAGGIELGRSDSRTKAQPTASQTIPSPSKSGGPSSTARINVAAVAAKVDPATVDLTSIVPSQGEEFAGTGMILTSSGEVLTNNHVIAEGTDITAQIDGTGKSYPVRVLGTDTTQDVALVQLVGASGLPTVALGNSSSVQVGDQVVAIGNALDLKGPPTVTEGIVSALGRSIQASDSGSGVTENLNGLIQTDAPINPGNSGGPLVDASAQVIGMDTAAANGSATQSATNIGFAIPINQAISIAQQIQQGKGSSSVIIDTGFLGVEVLTISQATSGKVGLVGNPAPAVKSGAYVAAVLQGTPALVAGLREGDVIVSVNGASVASPIVLGTLLKSDRPGQTVNVTWVAPSGARHTAAISLIGRPVA